MIGAEQSMSLPKAVLFFSALLAFSYGQAQSLEAGACETSKPFATPGGALSKTECGTAKDGYRETISVDGVPVLSDTRLFKEDRDGSKTKWVYTSGASNIETGCAPRLYLLDLSAKPARVIAFGVKAACNEFHWASWGEKRSVIALKNNVKFTYENGRLTPPSRGRKLLSTVEPPHSSVGGGMDERDAIPFADELSLPR